MTSLPPIILEILRLAAWLMALVVIFVPLERLFAVQPAKIFRKGIGVDLIYFFLSSLLLSLLLSLPIAALAWVVHRAVPTIVPETMRSLPLWGRMIAGLIAGEIGYYWGHRWCHEIPILWRFHAIHHSAEHCDFLVSSRAHPIDLVIGRFCMLVPMFVLGLGSPMDQSGTIVPVVVSLISTFWGFFIHANLRWRLGPIEWLLSSPAFHHWHHTKSGPINRNYASTLPWLDRNFGTYYVPNEWPADYGIKSKMPDSLIDQLFYPMMPDTKPRSGNPSTETDQLAKIRLRDIEQSDLPTLYEFNLDPEANRLAATIPRSADAFQAHWENRQADPNVVQKAILIGNVLAGCIVCFRQDGFDYVGFWLGKEFWGNGIASTALQLLLKEIKSRPLYARVATSNGASLRVLQKSGFVVESVQISPGDERYQECEEALLILR